MTIPRPVGKVKVFKKRLGYLPKILLKEVGAGEGDEIPFYIDANTVLLVRKDATLEDIIRSLEVLKEDLKLRAGLKK